ncbi:cupin-like domain-containing protein [Neptunicella sp.]|uniref:cupin-like domain-containing protein n=1 Tax=Neptunicella sp. TaxID=2125986 RepID=UPI003F69282C
MHPVKQWHNVDSTLFKNEIVPAQQPVILKGLIADWPTVKLAGAGDPQLLGYLSNCHAGGKLNMLRLPASENGYFDYNKSYSGFNFERKVVELPYFLEHLQNSCHNPDYATHALQSAYIDEHFPSFTENHKMSLFPKQTRPRIWLGNASIVGTHCDDSENIACVVAGKRRFTLFPPEQISNLYIGPLELTPAGAPMSMVRLSDPDYRRFPKFKQALAQAMVAELEPGDAIYIPTLWWHHVEALSPINMLVNYWHGGAIGGDAKPVGFDILLFALLTLSQMPEGAKKAWRSSINYYLCSDKSAFDHIPEHLKGMLGDISPQQRSSILTWLKQQLEQHTEQN